MVGGLTFVQMDVMADQPCGVTDTWGVWCWGRGRYGGLKAADSRTRPCLWKWSAIGCFAPWALDPGERAAWMRMAGLVLG